MTSLTDQVDTILERLGTSFLLSGYLPSALFLGALALFVLADAPYPLVVLPVDSAGQQATGTVSSLLNTLADAVSALLLPILLGVLLMALNTLIIRLFEGAYAWEQLLLWFSIRRNRKRVRRLYGELVELKVKYTGYLADTLDPRLSAGDNTPSAIAAATFPHLIQKAHHRLEQESPRQTLPRREASVKPTALGNAFAVLEEYPYERYGMDAMIYWPRLRPLVEAEYGAQLANYKMLLDMLLNVAFLAVLFGVICLVLAISYWAWLPGLVAFVAWSIAYASYQGGVQIVYGIKETISLSFDFYRHRLLKEFDLPVPVDLQHEQALWLQLGQFLRRGEGFYHPKWEAPAMGEKGSVE